ncbi:hypothetical protein [Pedobacter lusitanus]|uniref:hypothetical protein n=1 Tax=Pedobacter lusitanus TaxID=1503925 RepID=UPI000B1823D9|nr:hypothetical protein [Pedobacter lusitanus]
MMFRKAVLFFYMLITLMANCSRFFIFAGFEFNKEYIASNLCINRNRPELHCNGKCYLMKKIKQAEENEKKEAARNNLSQLEVSFCQEPFTFSFLDPSALSISDPSFSVYAYLYTNPYIRNIFRPPRLFA